MTQDSIIIEGLKVETVIGCLAWERQILQPLLIDLNVVTDLSAACRSDELRDTLNYAEICSLIEKAIVDTQPQLLEHAAHQVFSTLFQHFPTIEKIRITIRKPAIIPAAQSVAIQIERNRDHFCLGNRH